MRAIGVIAATALVLSVAGQASAGIIRVPSDYASLKKAVLVASEYDTILVAPGTYSGPAVYGIQIEDRRFVLKSEAGPEATILDGGGTSYYAFRLKQTPSSSLLEGFTLTNYRNPTGGAVSFGRSVGVTIRNCVFRSNASTYGGGAIHSAAGTSAVFEQCVFEQNEAISDGGAIYLDASGHTALQFSGCSFIENRAEFGGAIYTGYSGSPLSLNDCQFVGNSAEGSGGAIFHLFYNETAVNRCSFSDNCAGSHGGAISASVATLSLSHSQFANNHAAGDGGAVIGTGWVTADSCTFSGNRADHEGGALWCEGSAVRDVAYCTFVANESPLGAGIYVRGGTPMEIINSIIAFTAGGEAFYGGGSPQLSCCDLYGNAGGDWTGALEGQCGLNGNISQEPLFCMDASSVSPWTLASSSPCAPANTGECGTIGAWPVDCGMTRLESRSWGQLKALYR